MEFMSDPITSSVLRACAIVGSKSALARAVGVKPPTVQQWCTGERPVPPNKCVEIERVTGRKVLAEHLCTDVDWGFIRRTGEIGA
ncbi:DNA-binding transcriptional regulator YdaS (Cro superfamily) [Paraburkholderia sp. BL8N3]|nr:helix-turn-helix domain-containing protein [Paraburkholderia sp. BL8N3]TCK44013.1 DNA-binding transcriptional regulator YdaS (Cro superfamily) [Paraburkholderia sp. BL8N3]